MGQKSLCLMHCAVGISMPTTNTLQARSQACAEPSIHTTLQPHEPAWWESRLVWYENNETWRGEVICPKPRSQQVAHDNEHEQPHATEILLLCSESDYQSS